MSIAENPVIEKKVTSSRPSALFKGLLKLASILAVVYVLIGLIIRSPLYAEIALRPFGPNEYYDKIRSTKNCQEIFITSPSGEKLHAWLFRPPSAKMLVIVHHGNAGNISHRLYIASAVLRCGGAVLLYDYEGYGLSTGKPSLDGLLKDGLLVYQYARNELSFPANRIVNFGESIGTGVACYVASREPSAGLVLQSPIGSLPRVAKAGIVWLNAYPEMFFPEPYLDNIARIREIRVPVLLMHGCVDRVVPYQHSHLILDNANEPKRLVLFPHAGHNDMPADSPPYHEALQRFFSQVSTQPGG